MRLLLESVLGWFDEHPGRLYVVGTLLPLVAFALLLMAGGVRSLCRPFRERGGFAGRLYWMFGGDTPLKSGAYRATAAMALAAVFGIVGLATFLNDPSAGDARARALERARRLDSPRSRSAPSPPPVWAEQHASGQHAEAAEDRRSRSNSGTRSTT